MTTTTESIRSLAAFFSPSVFRDVIFFDSNNYKSRLKRHFNKVFRRKGFVNNKNYVRGLYRRMEKAYKNEYFYKNTVLNEHILKENELKNDLVLNEFKIGNSVADIVLLNGLVRVYEVKTELDSPYRLISQIEDYKKFADEIYLVISSKDVHLYKSIPEIQDCGIIIYDDYEKALKEKRKSRICKKKWSHQTIFNLLNKQEYVSMINEELGVNYSNMPNTQIYKKYFSLAKKIKIRKFQYLARKTLKKREKLDLKSLSQVPTELRYLCYSLDFDAKEYDGVFKFLSQKNVSTIPQG